jgi:hypothetical protein
MNGHQFTLENFHQFQQQLRVIIMSKENHDPMREFKSLEPKQQRLFNEALNKYIRALPDNFEERITYDFNLVCQEEIFPFLNTKYKNMVVRPSNEAELAKETKEYTELIFKEKMLENELTETQLNKIPIIDNK